MPKEPEAVEDLPAPSGSSGGGGGGGSMVPVLAIIILIPIITIGLAEFYIFPKVTEIVAAVGGNAAGGEHGGAAGGHGEEGGHAVERGEAVVHYEFNDIVANLRGSMNSRYIKVSFTVDSKVVDFQHYMDVNKAKILDATISVLSNLTMQDLDEPGIKNIVRSDLLNSFGSALHANVIDNLYFSEFVVQ